MSSPLPSTNTSTVCLPSLDGAKEPGPGTDTPKQATPDTAPLSSDGASTLVGDLKREDNDQKQCDMSSTGVS